MTISPTCPGPTARSVMRQKRNGSRPVNSGVCDFIRDWTGRADQELGPATASPYLESIEYRTGQGRGKHRFGRVDLTRN